MNPNGLDTSALYETTHSGTYRCLGCDYETKARGEAHADICPVGIVEQLKIRATYVWTEADRDNYPVKETESSIFSDLDSAQKYLRSAVVLGTKDALVRKSNAWAPRGWDYRMDSLEYVLDVPGELDGPVRASVIRAAAEAVTEHNKGKAAALFDAQVHALIEKLSRLNETRRLYSAEGYAELWNAELKCFPDAVQAKAQEEVKCRE